MSIICAELFTKVSWNENFGSKFKIVMRNYNNFCDYSSIHDLTTPLTKFSTIKSPYINSKESKFDTKIMTEKDIIHDYPGVAPSNIFLCAQNSFIKHLL